MTISGPIGPFDDVVPELHLEDAPLVRVLSQVRWDDLTTFRADFEAKAAQLATVLSPTYPIATKNQGVAFSVGPQGVTQQPADVVHTFSSADESWRVHLAPNFITLETSNYTSRDDFCARLDSTLRAVNDLDQIPRAVRVGYRYVNRIEKQTGFDELRELVRPEMLGGLAVPESNNVVVRQTLTEAVYGTSRGTLLAKWAVLPAFGTIDPTITGVDGTSWVLDLDSFDDSKMAFEPTGIVARAKLLASIGYGFFRWAVTPEFLSRFEGQSNVSN